jgi:hypothetical protein
VLVANACNPSYSGGRDQEDLGSKPVQANSLLDPILKNPIKKVIGGVAQGIDPEFKYCKNKTKKPTKGPPRPSPCLPTIPI